MEPLFDLAEWAEEPLVIKLHVYAALAGVFVGALVMLSRKGTRKHRLAGRGFAAALIVVLGTSVFIHEIQVWGIWSPIHLLTILTFVLLILAIRAIRRREVQRHGHIMEFIYLAGFVLAGAFTLLPDRLLHEVFLKRSAYLLAGRNADLAHLLSLILPAAGVALFAGVYLSKWRRSRMTGKQRTPTGNTQ